MSTNEFIQHVQTRGCASAEDIKQLNEGFHVAASIGAARRVLTKCKRCHSKCKVRAEVVNTGF